MKYIFSVVIVVVREVLPLLLLFVLGWWIASFLTDWKYGTSSSKEENSVMSLWSQKGKMAFLSTEVADKLGEEYATGCKQQTEWEKENNLIVVDKSEGTISISDGVTYNFTVIKSSNEKTDKNGSRYKEYVVCDKYNDVCIFRFIIDKRNRFMIYFKQDGEEFYFLVDEPKEEPLKGDKV